MCAYDALMSSGNRAAETQQKLVAVDRLMGCGGGSGRMTKQVKVAIEELSEAHGFIGMSTFSALCAAYALRASIRWRNKLFCTDMGDAGDAGDAGPVIDRQESGAYWIVDGGEEKAGQLLRVDMNHPRVRPATYYTVAQLRAGCLALRPDADVAGLHKDALYELFARLW